MHGLEHVRWVGGGSGGGKSTLAGRLAEQYDLRVYSCDATIHPHSQRLDAAQAPLLAGFRRMSLDQRWVQRSPAKMCESFPWFCGEGFDLIIDDLRALPSDGIVVVEGFRLLPRLVLPYLAKADHAVWLLPTPEFRRSAFDCRDRAEAFWLRTSDPQRALTNLLERDRLFTDAVAADAASNQLETLVIDGARSVDDEVEDLAARFDLGR